MEPLNFVFNKILDFEVDKGIKPSLMIVGKKEALLIEEASNLLAGSGKMAYSSDIKTRLDTESVKNFKLQVGTRLTFNIAGNTILVVPIDVEEFLEVYGKEKI